MVPQQAWGRFRTPAQVWLHGWARGGRCTSAAAPWGPLGTSIPQPPIPCEKSLSWKLICGQFSALALPCMSSEAADGLKATTRLLVFVFFFPQYLFFYFSLACRFPNSFAFWAASIHRALQLEGRLVSRLSSEFLRKQSDEGAPQH